MLFWRRKHPIADQELSAYVDGQLSPDARGRLEQHIESCAACRETVDELRALRSALQALPREDAPRSFALREADVRPQAPQPAGMLTRATPLLSGVTAAAFIAFGVLVGIDSGALDGGAGRGADDSAALISEEAADGDTQDLTDAAAPEESEDEDTLDNKGLSEDEIAALEMTVDAERATETRPDTGTGGSEVDDEAPVAPKSTPCPTCFDNELDTFIAPQPTMYCPPGEDCPEDTRFIPVEAAPNTTASTSPTPVENLEAITDAEAGKEAPILADAEADGLSSLRIAEIAVAAVGLVAAGSLGLAWWRRRA